MFLLAVIDQYFVSRVGYVLGDVGWCDDGLIFWLYMHLYNTQYAYTINESLRVSRSMLSGKFKESATSNGQRDSFIHDRKKSETVHAAP